MIESLTLLSPISHFYIPWKWYKTKRFLTFSEGIEMEHLVKVGYSSLPKSLKLSNVKHTLKILQHVLQNF